MKSDWFSSGSCLRLLVSLLVLLGLADAVMTWQAIRLGAVELNPVLMPFAGSGLDLMVMKFAALVLALVLVLGADLISKRDDWSVLKCANVGLIPGLILWSGVVGFGLAQYILWSGVV